jgi:hypothetical protein
MPGDPEPEEVPEMDPKPDRWTSRLRALVSFSAIAALVVAGLALFAAPADALAPTKRGDEAVVVSGGQCDRYTEVPLAVSIAASYSQEPYLVVVSSGEVVVEQVTVAGNNVDPPSASFQLPPGDYLVAASRTDGFGEVLFAETVPATVAACPDLDVTATTTRCSTGADGAATLGVTGLIVGERYRSALSGGGIEFSAEVVAESESSSSELPSLPPGNYTLSVQWLPGPDETADPTAFDWTAFAVEPCQPAVEVAIAQCTVAGGTAGGAATLSGLFAGVEYTVGAYDAAAPDGPPLAEPVIATGDATGAATVDLGALPPGRDVVVRVDGAWQAPPWEEPPWIGGGDFVPLDTVALSASTTATLAPCPAAPVAPAAPASAAQQTLPATGADVARPVLAAAVLIGLGALVTVLALRRRRRG